MNDPHDDNAFMMGIDVRPPMSFHRELEGLINRYSVENASDTPDFILAQYLIACLDAFNETVRQREQWYGRLSGQPATFRPGDPDETRRPGDPSRE